MQRKIFLLTLAIVQILLAVRIGLGAGEENPPLFFQWNGITHRVSVLPDDLKTGIGTDIWLTGAQTSINVSAGYPGQNRGPVVGVASDGSGFMIVWCLYRYHDVQLLAYDSRSNSTRLLPLSHFKTAYPLHVVYAENQPTTLLFMGNNSTNTDIFSYNLVNGDIKNITRTPESEQRWKVTDSKDGILLETSTLRGLSRYRVREQPHTRHINIQRLEEIEGSQPLEPIETVPAPEVLPLNTVVGFGDSITWGTIRMDVTNPEGDFYHPEWAYLKQLEQILAVRYGVIATINLGIPGNYTRDAVERMARDFADVHAFFCLIMFGTNDVTEYSYDLDTTIGNLEFIINKLRSDYHLLPVISTIPPQKNNLRYDPHFQAYKEITEELNQNIIVLANRLGIEYIDTYGAFFNGPYLWEDLLEPYKGNHPNPQGHILIANLFKEKILALPPSTPGNLHRGASNAYTATVQWNTNQEFDLDGYRLQFGFTPDSLNRQLTTQSAYYRFLAPPRSERLGNTLYVKIQAVDKDGHSSDFSPVYSLEFH